MLQISLLFLPSGQKHHKHLIRERGAFTVQCPCGQPWITRRCVKILTDERHESIIVSGFTELLHQGLGLLLGQLLTEVGQETEELVGQHGVVVIFVVQLQDLNEVVESSLVLAVLGGLVDGEDLLLGEHLLSLLSFASDLSDGLEGGVEVAGSDEVTSEESINLAISLEVIDIKSKVDGVNLLLLESKFLRGWIITGGLKIVL